MPTSSYHPISQHLLFVALIYNYYPIIIPSLLHQTVENWRLLLIHDGPCNREEIDIPKIVEDFQKIDGKQRIVFKQTETRQQQFGHPHRKSTLELLKDKNFLPEITHVNITNADNYYVPGFTKQMLSGFRNAETIATYCSHIPHNYISWNPMQIMLRLGAIDIAGVVIKREAAAEIGWHSMHHSSDWTFIQGLIKKYGSKNFVKVPGALVVHN